MNRPKTIIAVALAVYLTALGVAWRVVSDHAYNQTVKLLTQAEKVFAESIGDYIDAMLLQSSMLIMRDIGSARPLSLDRMSELAKKYGVDELNIADGDGVCIATSHPGAIGYDFASDPETAEFLKLLKGKNYVCQPFRRGKVNGAEYRKYVGFPFADGSGFLQLGMNFDLVYASMVFLDRDSLRAWRIGRNGNYDIYDADQDGACDLCGENHPDGVTELSHVDDESSYVRSFSYAGHRFVAVLSEREYFGERNLNFAIMAPMLAAVVLFLAWFVFSISRANVRERQHRAAEDVNRFRDLRLARTIQHSALPSVEMLRRDCYSFSFAAKSSPAKEVGGDFYDFYFISENRLAVVVADVSGKGIPAAMFMMKAKNEIAGALGAEANLPLAVRNANRRLCENNEAEMFVTAWIGVLDVQSGILEYVNAGHDRPFVRRADGTVEKVLGKGGLFLGMFPEATYKADSFRLEPSDLFFLFTDGITEAMNGSHELFGETRLKESLGDAGESPEQVIDSVNEVVRRFADGAEQSDDITALALVWHGQGGRHERSFSAERASLGAAMEFLRGAIGPENHKKTARLLNAADEVMTNIVNYSGSPAFTVVVENAPGRVRLTFTDTGKEYNPLLHVDSGTRPPLAERGEGGYGILIAKSLVDNIFYRREKERNILTLMISG